MNSVRNRLFPMVKQSYSKIELPSRYIHSSLSCSAGQEWRRKRGLPSNPNAYGPLTDLPDYTFIDGRRTPAGSGKLKRALVQQELAGKIMKLSSEIDFAVERKKQLDIENENRRQSILDRKLKQKGENLSRSTSYNRNSDF